MITAPMPQSQTTAVLVLVATGSKNETKEINGLSHFLEHMFFKGTARRPDTLAISEALDEVGGAYNAFTSKEFTGFWAKVASEHLDLALDWVADILLHSRFEAGEIEKEKGVILQEINMVQDTPMRYVEDLWEKLLYGDQPAGWDGLGTKDSVNKMNRRQFLDYFKTHYRAENLIVCLAGKIGDRVEKKVLKYFSGLKKGSVPERPRVWESQTVPRAMCHFKKTDQTHLCLGVRAYDIFHPDRFALAILGSILGGTMSSRLFISVREKKGLAYYIRTSVENYTDSGYLVTQAGVANDKVGEAIRAILKEYQKIRDQKISAREILKAKENFKGSTKLHLETSDEVASWLGAQEILKKEVLTPEQLFGKIEKVTAEDLQRVAQDIFQPDKLNLALIGPFKEKERFERMLKL